MGIIKKIHHVAYRCHNAKETAEFYKKALGMELLVSIAEDKVPSTKAPNPYMHLFLDAGMGNILAFFEITGEKEMSRDLNTPTWVQHIAFEVESIKVLEKAKKDLEAQGIEVLGLTDHGIFKSIYFFDPNGHRLELAANLGTAEDMARLKDCAQDMIDEWDKTKQPPRHAAWMHEKEFSK